MKREKNEMKLTKTRDGHVCVSDDWLRLHRCRGGWELRLDGHHLYTFANLAEAEAYVRPHWRPSFLGAALDRLRGDGLRLWDAAVLGDRQSFSLLLDWIEATGTAQPR